MANAIRVLRLRRGDRAILEGWLSLCTMQRRLADGIAGIERDRARSGRPPVITSDVEAAVIEKTMTEKPLAEVATHWSTRLMAAATGQSREAIGRIWRKYGLRPHQLKRFKLSRDPRLIEKIHDVVGLYIDPPLNAVVFSFDEKSQMQALDRTQPGLPLKKGRAGTMTHDYKRHGTTTLFAAMNVATGETIHECMPRHRHQEFLKFLRKIERSVEPGLEIHAILDNHATHKHEKVRAWLKRIGRVHLHFIPTGSSWLNMVERLFSELTEKQLKRLAVTSVAELESVVMAHLDHRNTQPTPFIWRKSAKEIIVKIERGLQTLASVH